MDEVRMVRDGYPEPAPPTAQVTARAKALLDEPPRRSLPRLRWGLGGLVAAGAATAVALALVGGNTPAPRTGTVKLDDRSAFLAAAAKAEQQPIGDYWYSDMVLGQSYVMRPKTGPYAITGALTEGLHWTGVRSGMGEAFYSRELPARPLTARDATLWRGAGSPSSFRVWSSDHYFTYTTTRATKWGLDSPDTRGGGLFAGGRSVEELQNLPTDPAELAAMFLNQRVLNERAAGLPPGRHLKRAQKLRVMGPDAKMAAVTGLLANAPLPSKVRAGLMRALATQPGVHSIGRATDPMGREGVALASDDRPVTVTSEYGAPKAVQGTYRYRMVAIFDEHTGALLSHQEELTKPGGPYAEMKPGFVINYAAARAAKWSDTKPRPPAELPFG